MPADASPKPDRAPRVVIVGAGISGMATALAIEDLARQRELPVPELRLLESADRVGGKIRTISDEGYTCEWGVNGFLNKEPRTIELCQRLELEAQLQPAGTVFSNRFIYTRKKLRPVKMHPLKFMFSGILPLGARLRLIRELWIKRRPPGDEESVADFARRRVGPGAFKVLVDSMQTGIFAGDPERMSVASCFPRVVEVEQEYGSLIKGMAKLAKERRSQGEPLPGAGPSGHLTSFQGGMQTLVTRMAGVIGDRISTDAAVRGLSREGDGYTLEVRGRSKPLTADAVVLACPAFEAAKITERADQELARALGEIPYSPLVVVCHGYPRPQVQHPMNGFGFLIPRGEGLQILGALWTSSLFAGRVPDDHVLVRTMIGGARDPDALDLDDRELSGLVGQELSASMGGDMTAPSFTRIFRHRCAIPQYHLGHHALLDRIEARLVDNPRLVITGNAYRGIGVNDCARDAWPAAERVMRALFGDP